MNNTALEKFGQLLIQMVRDNVIRQWDRLLDRKTIIPRFKKFEPVLEALNEQQVEMLRELGPYYIDNTLHDFLFMLEGSKWIKLRLETDEQIVEDIRTLTQGDLQGYIFIWAEKYSEERLSDKQT
jgi:hypothetical protein